MLVLIYALSLPQLAIPAEVAPAIKRVITMLDNLITELDDSAKDDEAKVTHFAEWAAKEITDLSAEVERLEGAVEEFTAVLATLNAKEDVLSAQLKKLKGEVATTESQMSFATSKRRDEKTAFTAEQQDFASAIAACGKAVKLLAAHYGDGSAAPEREKPDFLSFLDLARRAIVPKGKSGQALRRLELLQVKQPFDTTNNDRYEESTGTAMTIVDQIKVLKTSFEDDKQSAIEDEARLQGLYDKLMQTKSESLVTLKSDRDATQSRLVQTQQDIAENEGSKSRADRELADTQSHLSQVTKTRDETLEAYEIRKKDREEETEAVNHAVDVLAKWRDASFAQRSATLLFRGRNVRAVKAAGQVVRRRCPTCERAARLLQTKANELSSSMLRAASEAAEGLDALDDIVNSLSGLIDRLKEEQKEEKNHKDWCEKEAALTETKRDDHSAIVEQLKDILANLAEVVVEKSNDLDVNAQDITDEDTSFEMATELRTEEHTEYEHDAEEHKEAIMALNEAIDILAKYYANKNEQGGANFLQEPESGSGSSAVTLISGTRDEFTQALVHIEAEEKEAEKVYDGTKSQHVRTDNDLNEEKNTITVEKQTVESQIEQSQEDKKVNENAVQSAKNYLQRLGKSCYPLLTRYDERKKLRKEEERALEDAIDVLKGAA